MTTHISLGIGTEFSRLPAQKARRVIVSNPSAHTVEVRQDGAGEAFPIPPGQMTTLRGLADASQIEARCPTAPELVTVYFRLEN